MALKKACYFAAVCFLLTSFAFAANASPGVTVISRGVENAYGEAPEVDGLTDLSLQAKINGLLNAGVKDLQAKTAGQTDVNYTYKVWRNTPEFLSIMLKADSRGALAAARGLNIHLPAGKEYSMKELFTASNEVFDVMAGHLGWQMAADSPFALSDKGFILLNPSDGSEQTVGYERVFPFLLAGPAVYYIDHYRLTAAADGKLARAGVGALVVVLLEANRSAGYSWQAKDGGHPVLYLVGTSHILGGASSGWDMLIFGVSAPGEAHLELDYKRFWEKQPVKSIKIQVVGE